MAHVVLEDGQHTFDASAKEITLSAPYETLSLGQIISIIDLTTNDVLYDSETQRKDAISISGAVITHTHGNTGQADADELQVIVDIGGSSSLPIHVDTIAEGTAPQPHGIDASGVDAYTTIVTAGAERHHMHVTLQGSYDAIVSIDSGTTESFYIPANSSHVFDSILIANAATIQGKNANAGENYTKLSVTVW